MRKWFKDIRINKELTQSDVAIASNVDVTTINTSSM